MLLKMPYLARGMANGPAVVCTEHLTALRAYVMQAHRKPRSKMCLIASFYLVNRGLWHRLPGISGFGPAWWSPSRASVGSDANGHTTVGSL